jgi:hypothetical protein
MTVGWMVTGGVGGGVAGDGVGAAPHAATKSANGNASVVRARDLSIDLVSVSDGPGVPKTRRVVEFGRPAGTRLMRE